MSDIKYVLNFKTIEQVAKDNQPKKQNKFDGSIIMPPPNVTGNLHMGHALNNFIIDAIVRYLKFTNTNIQWIPGTDHGGIGTEMIVKNKLIENKIAYTKEQLAKELWEWKMQCENNIITLIKDMNLLIDWDSYKFTLDENPSKVVVNAFCKLYHDKTIYRAKRLVNWDITLQTVLSDIEVVSKNIEGALYYLKYETRNGSFIEIATTRPETLFADVAVAVNPDDIRYKDLIGTMVKAPLLNAWIPIIGDSSVEIEKGSGALKIDPAHASLDFEIGVKYNLPIYQIIDKNGKMCGNVPYWLNGLDRFKAREVIIEKLNECNLISRQEKATQAIPYGVKSGSVLEPLITEQWFFDMNKFSSECTKIITENKINLIPSHFINLYLNYVNNLQPWCISRQLVWGHRIPAWYDKDGKVFVPKNDQEIAQFANLSHLTQDTDVFDTWFSSALWPISTQSNCYDSNYINELLVTGSDILFFWVLKMIIINLALGNKNLPFKMIYLHGLVQDQDGKKMSKSVGNIVDPIDLFEREGLDVVRFAMLYSATSGRNLKFSEASIDKSRKFLIKIWNAFNFALNYINQDSPDINAVKITNEANLWIIDQVNNLENTVNSYMEKLDIYNAADCIYSLFWNQFCSVYIEVFKYNIKQDIQNESYYTLYIVIHKLLKIMHPFLPSITQYFYSKLTGLGNIYDSYKEYRIDNNSNQFNESIQIIDNIRSIGKNLKIAPHSKIYTEFNHDLGLLTHITKYNIIYLKNITNNMIVISINGIKYSFAKDSINGNFEEIICSISNEISQEIEMIQKKLSDDGFLKHADPNDITLKYQRLNKLIKDKEIYKI